MAEFETGTIQANGIRQHYYHAANPGKPVLILLHGVTDNGLCWVAVARELRDQYDIYMLDARGHGFSEAPEAGYGSVDRAADVAEFVQAMGLRKPVLFGHSMGADTAITTAARYPDLPRAVVLEDPPWREPDQAQPRSAEENQRFQEEWKANILRDRTRPTEELVERARSDNPQWPEVELQPWAESKQQVHPNVLGVFGALRQDWRNTLPAVRCPVLLVTADSERGAIVQPQTAVEAAQLWQNGREAHVADAGHCIHRDQFQPVMQAVKEFLAEVTGA